MGCLCRGRKLQDVHENLFHDPRWWFGLFGHQDSLSQEVRLMAAAAAIIILAGAAIYTNWATKNWEDADVGWDDVDDEWGG